MIGKKKMLLAGLAAVAVLALAAGAIWGKDRLFGTRADPAASQTAGPGQDAATEPPVPAVVVPLSVDQAVDRETVVWENSFTVSGKADPEKPLLVAGSPVNTAADGSFSCQVSLAPGSQSILVASGEEKLGIPVRYQYAVQSYSPSTKTACHPGQTLYIQVMARRGSEVSVSFDGAQVPMKVAENQLGSGVWEGFVRYTGQVKMPVDNAQALEFGPVTYRVTCDGITEAYESAPVTCEAFRENLLSDPSVTPEGYWDVGSGYIVELIGGNVETFSGRDKNDLSLPTNNYLPAGTVDYGSPDLIHNRQARRTYRALRCGIRVYADTKNTAGDQRIPSVNCYYGTLPDHNEIAIASLTQEGHHTYLTLDCLWKAPFYLDWEPQEYENVKSRRYYVEKFDARYIDITFCYATQFAGDLTIPEDHPLFQRAELIRNPADTTLRLWLKREGGFYGWHAYYNDNDQLVFRFLNPVTVKAADNAYGADLTGVTILLDVGHGGKDMGAAGHDSYGRSWPEGEKNLELALRIQRELESTGATVILNRTDNEMQLNHQERVQLLQTIAPDYCLSIHHNSSIYAHARGHETGFYTTFSQRAAEHTVQTVEEAHVYSTAGLRFYLYYLARQTTCPVVLTENGYLSNDADLEKILSGPANERKAKALVQGVANYYLELSGLYEPEA